MSEKPQSLVIKMISIPIEGYEKFLQERAENAALKKQVEELCYALAHEMGCVECAEGSHESCDVPCNSKELLDKYWPIASRTAPGGGSNE